MKLTSMQLMIAAIVGIALVALAVVAFLIFPIFTQLADLDAQKTAADQQVQQANALLGQLEQAKQRASSTQAELLKIGTEMPDSPQLPTLIMELQDIGNASGVEYVNLAPQPPSPIAAKNYTEVVVNVGVRGSWADLLDYFRRVNKSTRLLRIVNVSITPEAPPSLVGTGVPEVKPLQVLTVAFTVKAYVIGANGVVAPPEGGAAQPGGSAASSSAPTQ
jgi:Tfp pilus assembly protein PilO